MNTWTFPSSSGPAIYTTNRSDDGRMTCNCKGFTFKRGSNPRECKHIKSVIESEKFARSVRGEFIFASGEAVVVMQGPRATEVSAATIERAMELTDEPRVDMTAPKPMLASAMVLPAGSFINRLGGTAEEIMAATRKMVDSRFANGEYRLDTKLDGHRCTVVKRGAQAQAWSRPRQGKDGALPKELPAHILDAVLQLPDGIYDGELLVPGGNSWNVTDGGFTSKLVLVLFDLLESLGQDTKGMRFDERRAALELAVGHVMSDALTTSEMYEVTWENVLAIWANGGEGAIVKKLSSTYRPGWRSPEWIKVVQVASAVMTVSGFIAGKLGPHSVLALTGPVDIKSVKTLDNDWLAEIDASPEVFIGRRLVVQYTPRGGKPMHPRCDHWTGEGE